MKSIVLVLLVACAPAPASLPAVRIDRSLFGAVVSREAAETIVANMKRRDGEWEKQLIDEQEKRQASEARERAAVWWKENAAWVIIGSSLAAAAAGFAVGSQIQR